MALPDGQIQPVKTEFLSHRADLFGIQAFEELGEEDDLHVKPPHMPLRAHCERPSGKFGILWQDCLGMGMFAPAL
jgi:hypothetical protein